MSVATRIENRIDVTGAELRLILLESLQWCANNAVYFLGLIGIATYDLGGTAFLVAGITLVKNLMNSAGNIISGPIVDSVGPRKTALASCALSAFAALIIALIPISVFSVYFSAVLIGLSAGFINTCTRAYPAYLAKGHERLQRLNGLLVFYSNIAFALGPIVGSLLVKRFSSSSVFFFMALIMALCCVVTWGCHERFTPERNKEESEGISVLAGMVEGARLTFENPLLRIIFITGFLGFFAFGAFDSLEALYYRDVLAVDMVWLGYLSAINGITATVGSFIFTKLPPERVKLNMLLASLMVVGFGSMIYVGTPYLVFAIIGQFINGIGWGILEPVQGVLMQEETPLSHIGRVTGFIRLGLQSAGVLPLLVAPFLADIFGAQAVLFGASTIITCVGTTFFVHNWRHHTV